MPKKPDSEERGHLQELLLAQMIQIETVTPLLMEKSAITQKPFFEKVKAVAECESKKRTNA